MPVSRLTSASSQKYSSNHSMRQHINEVVSTNGEQIICVPPQQDIQLAASLGSEKSCNVSSTNWMYYCISIKFVGHG